MNSIKTRLIQLAGPPGGYLACRWLTRSVPKILMYHRFSAEPKADCVHRAAFDRQVAYMKRNFNVLSLAGLVDYLRSGRSPPGNSVVITVDDGYHDFYDIAFPVLRKYDVPATLYVTTRFVDGNYWLWPDRIRYVLSQSTALDFHGMTGNLGHLGGELASRNRAQVWAEIVSCLLSVDDADKLQWIDRFARRQRVEIPEHPAGEYRAVNWEQVNEMASAQIEIGGHTRTHPSLTRIDGDNLQSEILGCSEDIASHTGKAPASFCYPNGQPYDLSEAVKMHVRKAGYKGAVMAYYDRFVTRDVYELRRFSVSDDWFQFVKSINGVEVLASRWLNASSVINSLSDLYVR